MYDALGSQPGCDSDFHKRGPHDPFPPVKAVNKGALFRLYEYFSNFTQCEISWGAGRDTDSSALTPEILI